MPFADRDVLCVGCGVMFVFSAGEQQFFQEKGFINEPKHCKQCKAKRQGVGGRRRIETPVTCAECGNHTTVPFKPTQKRPILCATCFRHRPKAPDIAAA
jgi:CxxC-x17-CxxC domain-containing protein